MLYIQFIFLLLMLYMGSRYGGIGLGVVSAIGLVVEVFVFQMPPTSPPITVMLIIMAVVTCAAILEAAGGLKYMLQLAERILRANPRRVTFLGPLVTYTMTFMLGTGHAVYSVMPIIGDVALKNDIRPERPMAAASVAAQLGITASPISAAVVYYLSQLTTLNSSITLLSILSVTIPATLCGVFLMSLYSLRRGAVLLFILALVTIVIIAMFPEIRTIAGADKAIKMSVVIQMMMLAFGGLILLVTKTKTSTVPEGVVFKSGMVAAIAIFGIAWMSDTYFKFAMPSFKAGILDMVQAYPWSFALAMFAVSVVVNSQAATCRMMLPVALGMGLSPALVIGIMPSCYGYFFIPNYPSDIATCTFDVTGTTKIGKYYFNHSFMVPGLIGVVSACCVGYVLAQILI